VCVLFVCCLCSVALLSHLMSHAGTADAADAAGALAALSHVWHTSEDVGVARAAAPGLGLPAHTTPPSPPAPQPQQPQQPPQPPPPHRHRQQPASQSAQSAQSTLPPPPTLHPSMPLSTFAMVVPVDVLPRRVAAAVESAAGRLTRNRTAGRDKDGGDDGGMRVVGMAARRSSPWMWTFTVSCAAGDPVMGATSTHASATVAVQVFSSTKQRRQSTHQRGGSTGSNGGLVVDVTAVEGPHTASKQACRDIAHAVRQELTSASS